MARYMDISEYENWTPHMPVLVRALYSYDANEDDELSFREGDEFWQLSSEDDMGWCHGSKNVVMGMFPASYVEIIEMTSTIDTSGEKKRKDKHQSKKKRWKRNEKQKDKNKNGDKNAPKYMDDYWILQRPVLVRALYSYESAADDEISFCKGDVLLQLSKEDDLGWCKGSKNCVIQVFPASYVKAIEK